MKASVFFLNVGWGDSHAIVSPEGKLTLIDGGDGQPSSNQIDSPLHWMNRNNRDEIEWLIATHVHLDHTGGFLEVAQNKKIRNAILPYPLFDIPDIKDFNDEQRNLWAETRNIPAAFGGTVDLLHSYIELIHELEKQGTNILYRDRFSGQEEKIIWHENGIQLRQLFPWEEDKLSAFSAIKRSFDLIQSNANGWAEELSLYFAQANSESSIYVLESTLIEKLGTVEGQYDAGDLKVIFGADQEEMNWFEMLGSSRNLPQGHGTVWKAPHHGQPDAFSAATLKAINPDIVVIPISERGSIESAPLWNEINADWKQAWHLTCSMPKGEARLLADDGRISVWVGSK